MDVQDLTELQGLDLYELRQALVERWGNDALRYDDAWQISEAIESEFRKAKCLSDERLAHDIEWLAQRCEVDPSLAEEYDDLKYGLLLEHAERMLNALKDRTNACDKAIVLGLLNLRGIERAPGV